MPIKPDQLFWIVIRKVLQNANEVRNRQWAHAGVISENNAAHAHDELLELVDNVRGVLLHRWNDYELIKPAKSSYNQGLYTYKDDRIMGTRSQPFEQIRIVAAKVADASWRASKGIEEYRSDAPVAMLQREVPLNWRKPSEALMRRSKEILAMSSEEQANLPRLATNYAHRVLSQVKREGKADCLVQAIRIGDQAIVSFPFETFVEIGIEIKEESPFKHNFVIELANGSYGYLPTPKHHELGGYETWLGTSKVQKDGSEILKRNLLEMLNELHQAK